MRTAKPFSKPISQRLTRRSTQFGNTAPILELLHHKPAQPRQGMPPLLLIHGAWHAAWSWENWIAFLAEQDFEVYALSLRGHGTSEGDYRKARLRHYLADVQQVIARIGRQPILIGHSLGGWLIQHLLVNHTFPAAVLLASVPPRYPQSVVWRNLMRHPWVMLRGYFKRDLITFTESTALVRDFFTPETPEAVVASCRQRMTGASLGLFLEMAHRKPAKPKADTPTLVIAPTQDRNFTIRIQQHLAQRLGAEFSFLEGSGHDIPLDIKWRSAAQTTINWIENSRATLFHYQK